MTITAVQLRNHYARDSVQTASPSRLVTMLYDRLARDLDVAEAAIALPDLEQAHGALRHAQDIVSELTVSLDVERWSQADSLLQLYGWLMRQLVTANVTKDVAAIAAAREVVEPLREAWHEVVNSQALGA